MVSGGQKKEEMVNSSLQETGFISLDFCLSYDFVLLDYHTFCVRKCHQTIECNGTSFSGQVRLEE